MKARKGFTLLEAAVTLAILGIGFTIGTLVIVTLTNTQRMSDDNALVNNDFQKANDLIEEYVSFVSLDIDDTSFTFTGCNTNSISFTNDGHTYTLAYANNHLTVTNDYTGESDYLKFNRDVTLANLSNISFKYDEDVNLLVSSFEASNRTESFSYIVRAK